MFSEMVFTTDVIRLCIHTIDATQSSLLQALAAKSLEMNTLELWNTPRSLCPMQALWQKLPKHTLASGRSAIHLALWDFRPHKLTKSNVEKVCEVCLNDDLAHLTTLWWDPRQSSKLRI